MALKDTIMDVRNAQRAIKLRGIQDPKEVTDLLEKVLRDAVVAQSSGSRTFEAKSLQEMVQIRKDLVAGQINAGASKDAMVGMYSHLIDQMNTVQRDSSSVTKITEDTFKQFSRSIPSADTFISALMTANPLIGYGVKISRDILRATKAGMASQKEEKAKRLKNLKEQENFVKEQLKLLKMEQEVLDKEKENADTEEKDQKNSFQEDIYMNILKDIHTEMQKLVAEWTGEPIQDETKVMEQASNDPVIEGLEQVEKEIDEQTKQEDKLSQEEIEALERSEKQKERNSRFEKFKETDNTPKVDFKPVGDALEKEKGAFSKLIEGLLGPIMLLLRSSLVAFAGAAIGLFTTIIAIPALIATAIYKFLDGFFNAEEIIGKASEDITMLDRVKAGVANIWGTILKIVDWVTNLFGFDFFDSKDMEKKIYRVFDNAQNKIVSTAKDVTNYVNKKFEMVKDTILGLYDDVIGLLDATREFFSKKLEQITGFFRNMADKGIVETFKDLIFEPQSTEDPKNSVHRENDPNWNGDIPLTPNEPIKVVPKQITPNPEDPVFNQFRDEDGNFIDPSNSPYFDNGPTGDMPVIQHSNPNIIRMSSPENSAKIQGNPLNGSQLSSSMRIAEMNSQKKEATQAPAIIAPNTTNNISNQHKYMGPPTTANLDPDFRSIIRF